MSLQTKICGLSRTKKTPNSETNLNGFHTNKLFLFILLLNIIIAMRENSFRAVLTLQKVLFHVMAAVGRKIST